MCKRHANHQTEKHKETARLLTQQTIIITTPEKSEIAICSFCEEGLMSNNNQNINTNNEYNTEAMPMDCGDDGASLYLSSEELSSADKGQGSASPKRIFEDSSVEREEDSKKSKKGQMDSSAAEDGLRRAALTNLMVQNQTKNGQTVQAVASASNEQAQPEKSARLVKGFQTAETMFVKIQETTGQLRSWQH
jgi:hypothetical protein